MQSEAQAKFVPLPEQTGVAAPHASLQPLQFAVVPIGVSQSGLDLSQFAKPLRQTGVEHVDPLQDDSAFATSHESLHLLQLAFVPNGVSQPGVSGEQSPKPCAHAPCTHLPSTQRPAALGKLHLLPQLPQLVGSVLKFRQRPSHLSGAAAVQSDTHENAPAADAHMGFAAVQL